MYSLVTALHLFNLELNALTSPWGWKYMYFSPQLFVWGQIHIPQPVGLVFC